MIVQGGGPTAVFNISLAEIIAEAQRQPRIGRILGSRVGIKGLLSGEVAELTNLSETDLDRLRRTPGAALGSSRYQPSAADLELLTRTLLQFEVEYLIFLGGNGTMRGAELISQYLKSRNIDIHIVGVPKTVDNDIMETDRCPGFASAARYIATSTREVAADVSSLPQPVTILETMGRSVGWLAAASLIAQPANGEGAPHLICLPETPFDLETFLDTLNKVVRVHKWAVVVVAEGLIDTEGKRVFEINIASQADGLKRPMIGGVAQHLATIVSERLGFRCRNEKPGLIGRSSIAHVAAQDRVDAALVGCAGIHALLAGDRDVMVALEPLSSGSASGYRLVPLDQVGGHVRQIPAEWISPGALPVGAAFRDYLEPMVGPLDEHFTGLPRAHAAERVEFH
jgi:6-phosphofructokinase 1